MAPINAVELPTEDFGLWAHRAGLIFPVPLNAGYAARVELDWDELLTVSEKRLTVTNAVAPPEPGRSSPLREMLRYAARILDAPTTGLYAVRAELAGTIQTTAVGLSSGADGLVVVDSAKTVRLVRLPATDLAGAIAAAQPALRGFPMQRFELSGRALRTLTGTGTTAPSARTIRDAAWVGGLDPDQLEDLIRLQQAATFGGLIGAVRYRDGETVPGAVSAQWVETPAGAVLRREHASGDVVFESATRSTLTSAMVAAAAAPSVPGHGAGGASTTTTRARVRTLGENR